MFRLGVAPKETFLAYSTHFVFLTIRLVPGNVVMVAINMCGKSLTTEEWIYGISWKHVYLNISFLFTVDTTFILKLAFLLLFVSVLMQGHLGGCVVAIIVNVVVVVVVYLFRFFVYLFIYLSIYLFFFVASTVTLIFVVVVFIATVTFVVGAIVAFCVCVVVAVPNLMLMFSILILSCVPYFTVNSVGK